MKLKNSEKVKKKTFIISKLKENSNINEMIKEGFEDSTNYLKINPNLIIGIKK